MLIYNQNPYLCPHKDFRIIRSAMKRFNINPQPFQKLNNMGGDKV